MSKILIVDDDPGILRLLEFTLTKEEYQVLTASNGIEGLRKAQENAPDLLVLDVMLPGLDGFEVCHRLRSSPNTAQIPVIMVSAKGQVADVDTGLKVGADRYLQKPVDRSELLDTIQELLDHVEEARQTGARLMAFIGSRGGAGTSTTAASVAVILAQMNYSTVLVDLSSSFGSLNSIMGLTPEQTIADLFKTRSNGFHKEELEAVLSQHSSGVRLLSGEQSPEDYGKVTPAGIETLFQELSAIADYIVIDMPASPSEVVGAALKKCDLINLITTNRADSANKTSSAVALLSKLGVDRKNIGVVIVDRSGTDSNNGRPTPASIDDFPVVGSIPSDAKECADAEEHGVPLALNAPLSPATMALRKLTERLLSLEQLAPSEKKGNNG